MKAKKSLGQNFFVNDNLADKIVEKVLESNPKTVVEIGPGKGFFTSRFIEKGIRTIVVEKDNTLAKELKFTYPNLIVINEDFLDLNLKLLDIKESETVFFGSLPYNVSKPIIRKILQSEFFQSFAYFIIQKEVAEKYISKAPNSNILSLQSQLFANCKKFFDISNGSFRPIPKVTSSFVGFSSVKIPFEIPNFKEFNTFLIQCFISPRKTLRNNLKSYLKDRNIETEFLSKRPQELSLEEYYKLFTFLK